MITGAWERCPYVHPEGWGRCTLLDASGPHNSADGEPRHLCDPLTGTRGYAGRPGGKRMSGETRLRKRPGFVKAEVSKRDRSRWARKEEGQPLCTRLSPHSFARCHLIDNPGLHEHGHEGAAVGDGTVWNWPVDAEDWARWQLDGAQFVGEMAEVRPGTPLPTLDATYLRPPDWEDQPGSDYAFAFRPPTRRAEPGEPPRIDEERAARAWDAARVRGHAEIARYHRRVVGAPTMFTPSTDLWLLWFRTEEDADART